MKPIVPGCRCRSTTRAGSASAWVATWPSPSRPRWPTPLPPAMFAASGPRSMRCWSTVGRCRRAVPQWFAARREGPSGAPVEPAPSTPRSPFQISAAAVRAVEPAVVSARPPRCCTCCSRRPPRLTTRRSNLSPKPPPTRAVGGPLQDPAAEAQRRRNLMIGGGVAAVILVVGLIALASFLGGILNDDGGKNSRATSWDSTPHHVGGRSGRWRRRQTRCGNGVLTRGRSRCAGSRGIGDRRGSGDGLADRHLHRCGAVPNFKNGVGLMLQLPEPTGIGSVTVGVSSTGTQVQIRSAESSDPDSLADTTLLTGPPCSNPVRTIDVPKAAPTSHLLVDFDVGPDRREPHLDVSRSAFARPPNQPRGEVPKGDRLLLSASCPFRHRPHRLELLRPCSRGPSRLRRTIPPPPRPALPPGPRPQPDGGGRR